ncbi:hypothetical protein FRB99_008933 [Tulasnella sp. 403]|nr:hypothetical protein FRB99_008933 [Tulasnella sp. 403]
MASIRFLTSALAVFASACSIVQATPINVKRGDNSLEAKSFTSTGWAGKSPGLRLFAATNDGIQEILAQGGGMSEKKEEWQKGSFLHSDSFVVPPDAAMAATNAYAYGGDGIDVFFVATDKVIRNWEYSGGSWRVGSFSDSVPEFSGSLNANSYPRGDDGIVVSVFYTEKDGYIQEFERVKNVWRWVSTVGKINNGVQFTSSIDNIDNKIIKRVITADNVELRWTTGDSQWTTKTAVADISNASIVTGTSFNGNLRLYTNDAANNNGKNIQEYGLDLYRQTDGSIQEKYNKWTTFTKVLPANTAVKLSAASQLNGEGRVWLYVFHPDEEGKIAYSFYNGQGWSDDYPVKF